MLRAWNRIAQARWTGLLAPRAELPGFCAVSVRAPKGARPVGFDHGQRALALANEMESARDPIHCDEVVCAVVQATLGVALEQALFELFSHVPLDDQWLAKFGSDISSTIETTGGVNMDSGIVEEAKSEAMKKLARHLDRVAERLAAKA